MNLKNLNKIKISNPRNLLFFHLIASILIAYFFIWQSIIGVKEKNLVLAKNKEVIQYNADYNNNSSQIKKRLKELEPGIAKLNGAMINSQQIIEFITMLEGMEKSHSVTVSEKEITPPNQVNPKESASTPFSLAIRGPLEGVTAYLADLYNMTYLVEIINLDISASDSNTESYVYKSIGSELVKNSESARSTDSQNYQLKITGNLFWR